MRKSKQTFENRLGVSYVFFSSHLPKKKRVGYDGKQETMGGGWGGTLVVRQLRLCHLGKGHKKKKKIWREKFLRERKKSR